MFENYPTNLYLYIYCVHKQAFSACAKKKSRRKIWPFPSSCLGRKEQEITQEREWVENDSYRAEVMMRKDASPERDGWFFWVIQAKRLTDKLWLLGLKSVWIECYYYCR